MYETNLHLLNRKALSIEWADGTDQVICLEQKIKKVTTCHERNTTDIILKNHKEVNYKNIGRCASLIDITLITLFTCC